MNDLKNINGTSLQGYLTVNYKELVRVFGQPTTDGDGEKVDAEWHLQTPFGIATIYNYKDGKNYIGKDGLYIGEITEWHIGGHNRDTANFIVDVAHITKITK